MKKAQLQQAFVYIMAALVIGIILVMGFKYINVFIGKKCDVELLDFKTEIDRLIDKNSAYGGYFRERLRAPCDYEQVCFVDARAINNSNNFAGNNPIINQSVTKKVEQNIFLLKDMVSPAGYNAKIRLVNKDEELCIKRAGGYFNIGFRGQGRTTLLEEIQ